MDLVNSFNEHLAAEIADSPRLQELAYRLRYHIYCTERGYERSEEFPDGLETDEYDHRSIHSLVYHRGTGAPAGVVRLVMPEADNPEALFPIEEHCLDVLDWNVIKSFGADRSTIAEVSRFAVAKDFKRRPGEAGTLAGVSPTLNYEDDQTDHRRHFPHISLGLIAMLFAMSAERGITHWYAVMEPALARLLTRFGIRFAKVGPLVEYHGRRQPMMACLDDLLRDIERDRPDFLALIHVLQGLPEPRAHGDRSRSVASAS